MALKDSEIRAAKLAPGQTLRKLYDRERGDSAGEAGLFILIRESGAKHWRWKYHYAGKEKLMALGEYPYISLAKARELAAENRKLLLSGIDPMGKRSTDSANTFEAVARKWHEKWSVGKSPRHADYVIRRLEADAFKAFGHKAAETVTPADIRELMLAIEQRGARDVAKRAHETVSQVYRYGVANGLVSQNPAIHFKPSDILKAAKETNFARVEARDLAALLVAMRDYKGDAKTLYAMQLMSYTFVRISELIEAPWVEFDLDNAKWEIPPERMKMDRPHIVPLSRQAVEVLRGLHRLTGNGKLVFPGANDRNKPMNKETINAALDRMGYKGRQTTHGFRAIASTLLHEQGYNHQHIEIQLSHIEGNKVSAAYNKALYLNERTKMMQEWADFLDSELERGKAALAA